MINSKYYPLRSDILETEEAFVIKVEMAGCKKEDIKMYVQDETLNISACFKSIDDGEGKYIHRERFNGNGQREFKVGKYVDTEHISAKFDNGILDVKVPKLDPQEIDKKNRISIL